MRFRRSYPLLRFFPIVALAAVVLPSIAWCKSGTTLTPDGLAFMVSKDVGADRWTINLNLASTQPEVFLNATGNVFHSDGSAPSFLYCSLRPESAGTLTVPTSEFKFSCAGADACNSTPADCAANSWQPIADVSLAASFFKTHEMKVDLVRNPLEGVTPIILLFLARHGFEVNGAEPFIIDAHGAVREVSPQALDRLQPGELAAVRIRFQKPGEKERRIHYVAADVSDGGLAKTPVYLDWVRRAQTRATMIKSASYLMHSNDFSKIRAFIVERSQLVVQDDSGIPVRYFATDGWTRRFYGQYNGPIPMFNNRMQKDLRAAFVTEGATPIDFSYGYHFRDRGNNIQRYVRNVAVADGAVTPGR